MTWVSVTTPAPHVRLVAFDRPPVNALDRTSREELIAAFEGIRDDEDALAVVLTGGGRVFCAGADIREKERLAGDEGSRTAADRLIRELFFTVLDGDRPVIAAVNGPAVGAGLVLAACCDLIVASERAVFAMPEIDVGQGGGASILQSVLPRGLMRRMMLTGERFPPAELLRVGAIDSVWPHDEFLDEAVRLATTIAAKNPAAVRAIRGSLGEVAALPPALGFLVEQRYTTRLSTSPEAAAARRAFFERDGAAPSEDR